MRIVVKLLAIAFLVVSAYSGEIFASEIITGCGSACAQPCCLEGDASMEECSAFCDFCELPSNGHVGTECDAYWGIGKPTTPGYICDCGLIPPG